MHVMLKLLLMKVLLLLQLTAAISDENSLDTKIIGGVDTDIGDVPYQVSVRLAAVDKKTFGRGHSCGGTAISRRLVLTAGHCILNRHTGKFRTIKDLVLVMGTTYLRKKEDSTKTYNVKEIIVHTHFKRRSLSNDIALMIIDGSIHTGYKNINVLPFNTERVAEDIICTVSGWGRVTDVGPESQVLKSAAVRVISRRVCRHSYSNLNPSKFCAGFMSGGVGSCSGDSGGPLQCHGVLVGIVSYGKGCGKPNYPTVYTNVSYYKDWIRKVNDTIDYPSIGTLRAFPHNCLIVLAMFLTREILKIVIDKHFL